MNDFTGMTNPTYSNASGAVYEEIKMEPNPSYKNAGSKATTVYAEIPLQSKESDTAQAITAYAEIPLQSEESEVAQQAKQDKSNHEYDDIVNVQHIKMTRNPSYHAP